MFEIGGVHPSHPDPHLAWLQEVTTIPEPSPKVGGAVLPGRGATRSINGPRDNDQGNPVRHFSEIQMNGADAIHPSCKIRWIGVVRFGIEIP